MLTARTLYTYKNEVAINNDKAHCSAVAFYPWNLHPGMTPSTRPLKKVLFDTTGFLGAQNLTQERRDSRQNLFDNRSKEQCFEAIC